MTLKFDPPARRSTNVVVGIDPPAAWAIWGEAGPLAMGQAKSMFQAARELRDALAAQGIPDMKHCYAFTVERPHGTHNGNIQTLIVEAMAAGWWIREGSTLTLAQWAPPASSWRRFTGTKGRRKAAKQMAVNLATAMCKMAGKDIPRTKTGKPCVDACEALCIAFATWVAMALVVKDDVAHKVIDFFGIPYSGKPGFIMDTERIFNVRATATLKEDQLLTTIADELGALYAEEDDHDPWSEARPKTEGEAKQREADSPDDDGEDRPEDGPDDAGRGTGGDGGASDSEG